MDLVRSEKLSAKDALNEGKTLFELYTADCAVKVKYTDEESEIAIDDDGSTDGDESDSE